MTTITITIPKNTKLLKSRRAFTALKKKLQADNTDLSAEPKQYPAYLLKAGTTASETGWSTLYVVYVYPEQKEETNMGFLAIVALSAAMFLEHLNDEEE